MLVRKIRKQSSWHLVATDTAFHSGSLWSSFLTRTSENILDRNCIEPLCGVPSDCLGGAGVAAVLGGAGAVGRPPRTIGYCTVAALWNE